MNSLAERITKHHGGDWHGTYGNYPAEGHSRRDRGVSIRDAPDAPNGILLNVHNGGDALSELDRLRRDGFLPKFEPRQPMQRKPRAPGITYFEYTNANGEVVCRKKRIDRADDKDFLWEHPDGKGGWLVGRGCDALPYRLPDLLSAPADAVFYVAEGERKADKLASWGLVATSSKDLPADLIVFSGRTVAILPDNDKQGLKIAGDLVRALEGVAERAFLIELPGLPEKGDVIDWTGTADDLRALVENAMAGDEGAGSDWPSLDLLACAATKAPEREWVIDGWVPANKVTLFSGDGGVGKSLLAQIKATCVAFGRPFMGIDTRQTNAAYLSWEDDADELWRRQEAICAVMDIPMSSLAGRLHLVSYTLEESPFLVTAEDVGLRVTPLGKKLEKLVERHGIGLLILDNASQIAGIDHNAVEDVAPFAHWLGAQATRNNGAVVLLHHTNKQGQDYLGSVSYNNQFRSRMLLARPEGCDDPDVRELTNPKANYTQAGNRIQISWFKGAFILEDDMPHDIRAERAETAIANAENEAFLGCLRARAAQGDGREVGPAVGPNYAPSQFEGMPQAKGFGKVKLKRAMDRLYEIGKIKSEIVHDRKAKRDKTVIVEVSNASHNLHNALHNDRTTQSHIAAQRPHNMGSAHTLYTTYISGAANEAAGPLKEEEDGPDLSRVVFVADDGLDANGDVIGWND